MLDIKQIESFYPEHLRPFKKNLLREYLQYKILEAIFESPLADNLTFLLGAEHASILFMVIPGSRKISILTIRVLAAMISKLFLNE